MKENHGELNMSVSAVCQNDKGQKYAFVTFSDGLEMLKDVFQNVRFSTIMDLQQSK